MKQINVLWVCACIINHIFVKIIRMPVLDVSCYSLNLRCNNVVIYLDHSISVLKAIPWCKHIALIKDDFLPRTATPLVSWCKHCCNNFFFWVDPGQPIWPVTRSLDRVNDWVGFQNYVRKGDENCVESLKKQPNFYAREGKVRSVFFTNKPMILLMCKEWYGSALWFNPTKVRFGIGLCCIELELHQKIPEVLVYVAILILINRCLGRTCDIG